MEYDIRTNSENGSLRIFLSGRIDTSNAAAAEKELLDIIAADSAVPVFDMDTLEYISSAGLRVLMKIRKGSGEKLRIENTSQEVYEILETTGFTEIFDVSRKMREISVEGCKVIGQGFYGTVYRLDEETIVKVYQSGDCMPIIQKEKELARTALIAGVPTAISYDIVRVGDSYGSVFELLDSKTLNDLLIEQPERTDEIIKQYASFLRMVNERTVPEGRLKSAKQIYMSFLDVAAKYIDADLYERLKALLDEIPEQHTVIHGDAQMKNIMAGNGEPMLIDMETLCEGYPIFDLQSVYVTYFAFGEDEPTNSMDFLGIPASTSERVWELFVGSYFGTDDPERIAKLRDKITVVGCIRFISLIDSIAEEQDDLFRLRISHTTKRLAELAERVDSLLFDK